MHAEVLFGATLLLTLERITYVWICRAPDEFRRATQATGARWAAHPVPAVAALFAGFKILQAGVFAWWCAAHAQGPLLLLAAPPLALGLGALLVLAGQALSTAVFLRLGADGVFYGNRFGCDIPWCRAFPFTWFRHPQYVGAVLSIWGFFLMMRYPADDWVALPLVETALYAIGAHLESEPGAVEDPAEAS